MWCQDSPNESSESQKTLVEWSSTAKRRVPKKWQTELIDQVTWWSMKIRTAPPQSAPVSPSATVPPIAQPRAKGAAKPASTKSQKPRWITCMPRSS